MATNPDIRLVVFDWAGTAVDYGCFAPVAAFVEAFNLHGIEVSSAEARGPMGLHKKDHIREMFRNPRVSESWHRVHRRAWNEDDVEKVFRAFIPLQMEVIDQHSDLIPGLLDCVSALRKAGIKIGATTGYFRQAAERVYAAAKQQGYVPDCCLCPDDTIKAGRPAPWMIFRIMETLDVYPPRSVIKIGDTVHDIEEGLNAGAWTVGVVHSGNDVGCAEKELAELPDAEREARFAAVKKKLFAAGAHWVIDSVAELPELLPMMSGQARNSHQP